MAFQHQFQFPAPSTTSSGAAYNITTPQTTYSLYTTSSQGNSPTSGHSSTTATPQNSSPTSPHTMQAHQSNRQLRPQKVPMYVPAVLRPTQHPPRSTRSRPNSGKFTPPDSTSGSLESTNGFEAEGLRRSNTAGSTNSASWGLSSVSSGISRVGSFREGRVDGPSREHWKPDAQADLCDAPSCKKTFSLTTRRHHCRRCGNIFCDQHSRYVVPLDQNASFSPDGVRARSCDHCFNEFVDWERKRVAGRERANTTNEDEGREAVVCKDNNNKNGGNEGMIDGQRRRLGRMESIAASIPRDWNWSTF